MYGHSTVDARIPVGSNAQVLTADSAQTLGLKWATPTTGTVTSVATAGLLSGGTITTTGTITTSIATNKLVGRGSAGTGVFEAITLGTGLSFSGTTLNAARVYILDASNNIYSSNAGVPVSGSFNFFNGLLTAGLGNSTGNYNMFAGAVSGYYNSSGSWNTFLSAYSGYTNTTGNRNIAIGAGVLLPSGTASRQLNIGNLIYGINIYDGATNASSDIQQDAKLGLGTQSPLVREHVVGEYATLPAPIAFSASLSLEVPVAATPIDTPVLVYQPLPPTSSGFGYDASQVTGSGNYVANGQTITATVFEGRTLGGLDYVDPGGFLMTFTDLINDGVTQFFLDWYWTPSNNSDGSTPDFLIFVNSTTGFIYKITPGTLNFFYDTATDPGSVPSYSTFTGFASSGQTFNFNLTAFNVSPSGNNYFSASPYPYSIVDTVNNGSLLQIQHVISGAGTDLWRMVQGGAGGQDGSGNTASYQTTNLAGTTTTTPIHYGFQSGVNLYNRDYTDTSRSTSRGELYSASSASASTVDPIDGNYYSIGVGYNNPSAEGARLTETIGGGTQYYKDVTGNPTTVYIDALGGTFTGVSPYFTPTYRSYPAIYAENTSDDTYYVPGLIVRTTNANASMGWAWYEQTTLKSSQRHYQSAKFEFFDSSGVYDFITANSSGPTMNFKNNVGTVIAGLSGAGKFSGVDVNVSSLTASKPVFTDGSKNLTSTGTIPVANGGTGNIALAALTKTDDTNVTLTLGGSPTTALVNAASLTLGWTGTLAISRGGTGASTLLGAGLATVTNVSLTNQSADITTTNLATVAGLYRVSYNLQDTTSDITAGIVTLTISYTDGAGATTTTTTQALTGVGRSVGSVYIQLASGNLTYATSHTGIFGSAKYALYLTTERLS